MIQNIGRRTFCFEEQPVIIGYAAVAGKKEGEGPLSKFFDRIIYDPYDGMNSFEEAESCMQSEAVSLALEKSGVSADEVDFAFAGDLLNQCTGSGFCLRNFDIPYLGQYGACSTMGQGLMMAALFVESGAAKNAVCATSSHFCSAERQYRFPLEYGSVRTPTAQWTVTGAGSCVVAKSGKGARVAHATVGKIIDLGITDANNMGAAMAPAAADTISAYFFDTQTEPSDYDLILTGDLGLVGSRNLRELLRKDGIDISANHSDCGMMIFDRERQDVHAGGSGCGCCATVLCGKILRELENGDLQNILFIPTGALLSATTAGQNQTIPSIAHLVHIIA